MILPPTTKLIKVNNRETRKVGVNKFIKKLVRVLREYFLKSSFHGFKFLFEEGIHWTSRIYWLICIFISWFASALLIRASWYDFVNNAISFGPETTYLDWDTQFPSIWICEVDNPDKLADVTDKLYGDPHDYNIDEVIKELTYFRGLSYYTLQMCDGPDKSLDCPKNNFSYYSNLVRSSCQETIEHCKWNDVEFECCKYFSPIDTELGTCYSINSLHARYHQIQSTFSTTSNRKTGPGKLYLEIKLSANVYTLGEEEVASLTSLQTDMFSVTPHIHYRRYMAVKEIDNEAEVRSIHISQRKCRYSDENILDVYQYYSYSACCVQCRKDAQLKLCNCTHHLMPNTDSKLECDLNSLRCLNDNYHILAALKAQWSQSSGLTCDCLPSCSETEFSLIKDEKTGVSNPNAVVEFILERLPTERFKRRVIRGRLDLVVSMGGTTGLFVGASILSFVEFIYFIIIRIY